MQQNFAPRPLALRINGVDRSLALEARVSLLDALREHLDLSGTKKGCNQGADLAFEGLLHKARTPDKIMRDANKLEKGDAEAALRNAAVRFDAFYRTPRYNHNAIELHAIAAHWEADDALTIHDASQTLCSSRYTLAKSFGLKEENIRILAPFVGGAFGNKGVWNHPLLCVAVARIVGRAAPPHRARKRPDHRHAVFEPPSARSLPARRRAFWLGRPQQGAGFAARRRMAGRPGRCDRDLSLLPYAGRTGAHPHQRQRPCRCAGGGA